MPNTGDSHQDIKVLLSNTRWDFLIAASCRRAGICGGHQGSGRALVLFWSVFFEQTAPFKDISKLAVNSNSIGCGTTVGVNMGPFHPFYPCRSISLCHYSWYAFTISFRSYHEYELPWLCFFLWQFHLYWA